MVRRLGLFVSAAAVLGGCTSLGLDPFPKPDHKGDTLRTGLDPFPAPRAASERHIGLDPFPQPWDVGHRRPVGLDPFPVRPGKKTLNTGETAAARPAPSPSKAEAAPAAPPPPPPAPRLEMKFEKGAVNRYRMATDMNMKMPMLGEEGMKMKMGMDMKQEVRDVRADASAVVASMFEAVSFEMSHPMMGTLKVDTKDPASLDAARENPILGQMAEGLTGLVGKSIEMTLDRTGKTISVEAKDLQAAMSGLGGGMGGDMSSQMTGLPGGFPDSPISEGLSWPLHQEQPNPMGKMLMDGKMTVKKWDAATRMATISFEALMSMSPAEDDGAADEGDEAANMAAQMAKDMKMKEGKTSGEILFDVGRGRLVSSRTSMTLVIEHPMMGEMSILGAVDLTLLP